MALLKQSTSKSFIATAIALLLVASGCGGDSGIESGPVDGSQTSTDSSTNDPSSADQITAEPSDYEDALSTDISLSEADVASFDGAKLGAPNCDEEPYFHSGSLPGETGTIDDGGSCDLTFRIHAFEDRDLAKQFMVELQTGREGKTIAAPQAAPEGAVCFEAKTSLDAYHFCAVVRGNLLLTSSSESSTDVSVDTVGSVLGEMESVVTQRFG